MSHDLDAVSCSSAALRVHPELANIDGYPNGSGESSASLKVQLHLIMIASPCMFHRWKRPSGSDEAGEELHLAVMKWMASF